MANSLQDQLIKAGVAKPKQARKARKEKARNKKAARARGDRPEEERDLQQQVSSARAEQRERDKRLAAEHNAERRQRELDNTVSQIVNRHRIRIDKEEVTYRYTMANKVYTLHVSEAQRRDLAAGRLAIAWHQNRGHLLPRAEAERLMDKVPDRVWLVTQGDEHDDPDDPYAEFKVPDDLMW